MIVVDASVAIKWFRPEEGAEEAANVLSDHIFGREDIFVPDLLFYEVVNTLRYKSDLEPEAIEQFIDILSRLELKRIGTDEQYLKNVFRTARECDISVYDASYVALAEVLNCTLLTADVKLANKVGERLTVRII